MIKLLILIESIDILYPNPFTVKPPTAKNMGEFQMDEKTTFLKNYLIIFLIILHSAFILFKPLPHSTGRCALNSFSFPTHQYSIRRFEFYLWLLQMVSTEFYLHDVHNIRLINDEYVVDDEFSAHYLVGAGGTHCPVYQTFIRKTAPRLQSSLIVEQEEEFQYDIMDTRCKLWFFENKLPGYAMRIS